jgi:outer membrane lipoprotein-sorting protein
MNRQWLRWLPAAVVPALVAAGAVSVASRAGAEAELPEKSPAEVLAMIGERDVDAFSGTFEQSSALGLPAIPGTPTSSEGVAEALELLTGSHTARVYVDGPERLRLQVLDRLGERDVVRNGGDVWVYDFAENAAVHLTLPEDHDGDGAPPDDDPARWGEATTPAELADRILSAVEPSTEVTLGTDTEVAGRAAYRLVLTPRSAQTLVASVTIAVDAENGLPLAVDVRAREQEAAAFRTAYTALTLETPDPERFAFTPPPGATVEEHAPGGDGPATGTPPTAPEREPITHGTAWETVIETPAGDGAGPVEDVPLLAELTTPVPGGRLLSTALLTVLLTDDGRVLAGPVTAERLLAVAAGR